MELMWSIHSSGKREKGKGSEMNEHDLVTDNDGKAEGKRWRLNFGFLAWEIR